jgi:Tfp pilus assembly protein PilF
VGGWAALRALVGIGVLVATTCAQAADFELIGHLQPEQPLPVYLQGATTPFNATTEADLNGRFHFRMLLAGAYVLMVGGLQRTVEVGPSLADSRGRVRVTFDLRGADAEPIFDRKASVSVRELSIPKEARREYADAQKALERRDVSAAVAHLKRALDLAPQFSAAWNHLGTIAYQTGQYVEAEADFRKALEADPDAYAPLVNLGGVLINLTKWDEALECNRRAALKSPNDALANSQLGMAYFYSGKLDAAEKYLRAAKQIDPAHFSHPQLLLAEIHLRRNEPEAAAGELEDLLQRHPDLPNASQIREEVARLRAGPSR